MTGALAVGITAHLATSAVQKKKRDQKELEEEKKKAEAAERRSRGKD